MGVLKLKESPRTKSGYLISFHYRTVIEYTFGQCQRRSLTWMSGKHEINIILLKFPKSGQALTWIQSTKFSIKLTLYTLSLHWFIDYKQSNVEWLISRSRYQSNNENENVMDTARGHEYLSTEREWWGNGVDFIDFLFNKYANYDYQHTDYIYIYPTWIFKIWEDMGNVNKSHTSQYNKWGNWKTKI